MFFNFTSLYLVLSELGFSGQVREAKGYIDERPLPPLISIQPRGETQQHRDTAVMIGMTVGQHEGVFS